MSQLQEQGQKRGFPKMLNKFKLLFIKEFAT